MTARARSVIVAAFVAAGLVGAHVLDYAIAFPDHMLRAHVLLVTGHGYFSEAIVIAVVAGVIGVAGTAALGYRGGRAGDSSGLRWRSVAARLAVLQTVAFVALELTERIAANAHFGDLIGRPGLIGVAVQVVVACLGAAVLSLVARAARAVGLAASRSWTPASPRAVRTSTPPFEVRPPRSLVADALSARAPPVRLGNSA